MTKRILIVAMPNSVHLSGWINLARATGAKLFLLGVYDAPPLESLGQYRSISCPAEVDSLGPGEIGLIEFAEDRKTTFHARDDKAGFSFFPSHPVAHPMIAAAAIEAAVELCQPHIVHSMETQLAGYLTLEARRRADGAFPYWLHSNWGSDLFHFRKLPGHRALLVDIAKHIDAYTAECARDHRLFSAIDNNAAFFGPIPNSGGLDADVDRLYPKAKPPSQRRTILVKGGHGWSGRANTVLAALALIPDALNGYTVRISRSEPPVQRFAEFVAAQTGVKMVADRWLPRAEAMTHILDARISIGLSITDGISTSMLEAMGLGAFPIQTCCACADEWLEHGKTGFVVSPHNTHALAGFIRLALEDDALVDSAAGTNRRKILDKWTPAIQQRRICDLYQEIFGRLDGAE